MADAEKQGPRSDTPASAAPTATSVEKAGPGLATTELGVDVDLAKTGHDLSGESDARRLPTPVFLEDQEEGPDPRIGKVLSGIYKVEERIGEGGMGTVYRVRHVHLNKAFAVKVLSARITSNSQAIERLRQEAVAASSIDHDNIVDVVNFDTTDDGDVFIVMELLKGSPLSEIVEHGPLDLKVALHYAVQMCRALHAAHEAGIVHRDLKPENLFIVRKREIDFVKVLDFGISKVKTAETEQVRMTKTGQLVGTPLYMSPEQAKGEPDIDRRADVYAMGIILYEMLTGTPPFEGGNYFQLLWKHGNEAPTAPRDRESGQHIPPGLDAVVMKALEKAPTDRFQSLEEMEAAIVAAVPEYDFGPLPSMSSMPSMPSQKPESPTPEEISLPPARTPRAWLFGGVALALVAAVGVGVALSGDDPPTPPADEDVTPNATATDPPEVEPTPPTPPVEPEEIPPGVEPPAPVRIAVSFTSEPSGAQVTVNGIEIGQTPLRDHLVEAVEGEVEVLFSRRGHRPHVARVQLTDGGMVHGRLSATRIDRPAGTMIKMTY
ncbi:MAG: serine/threonine-protein kinase [Myxococcota bacterium]